MGGWIKEGGQFFRFVVLSYHVVWIFLIQNLDNQNSNI